MSPSDRTEIGEELFNTELESSQSTWNQYVWLLNVWVFAPVRIMVSDWRTLVGSVIISMYVLMGTVGVRVVDTSVVYAHETYLQPLENGFILGTDGLGRAIFPQVVHATPAMLEMLLAGAVFSTIIATVVGTVSGYKGGPMDRILSTATDVAMTIPGLPLVIVLAAIVEPQRPAVVGILLSLNAWAGLARSVRSEVLSVRTESFVEASRIMGLSTTSIIRKNILPNLLPFIAINFVQAGKRIIFGSVALYYLGVLPFSNLNWGVMLNEAFKEGALSDGEIRHLIIVPMVTIILLTIGMVLLSQGAERVFNPRIRARHANQSEETE